MVGKLGSALGALFLASSLTTSSASYLAKRALVAPQNPVGNWTSQGCYVDVGRTLTGNNYADNVNMTIENCINYCSTNGYIYAGTEYSTQCFCGNSLASGSGSAPTSDCNTPCSGNATEACGGGNRLDLYWSGTTGPSTNLGVGNWSFSGCYTEGTTGRTLPNGVTTTGGSGSMTVALCLSACQTAGYPLAGVEYSGECYCGTAVSNGGALATDGLSGCNMLCNGNYSEFCGGSGHLGLYDYNSQVTLPPYTTVSSVSSSSTASSSSTKVSTSSTLSSSSTKVSTSSSVSSLSTKVSTSSVSSSSTKTSSSSSVSSTKTPSSTSSSKTSTTTSSSKSSSSSSTSKTSTSKSSSKSSSSTSSGTSTSKSSTSLSSSVTKSSSQSSSKSTTNTSSSKSLTSSQSSSTTSSLSSSSSVSQTSSSSVQGVLSSTSSSATASPTLGIKSQIGAYGFQGCYTEGTNARALSGAAFYNYTAMTLEMCAASCQGFMYWGVEYGGECYCGNVLNTGSIPAAATDCSFTCPGNAYEYCGAGNRLELYMVGSSASSSSVTGTVSTSTGTGTVSMSSTTSSSVSVSSSAVTGLPTGWAYYGCYVDGLNGRILQNQQPDNTAGNTIESCVALCAGQGYTIAGTEYSVQCFCGNAIYNGGALAAQQTDCNDACSGNSKEMCGGGSRMSLYSVGTPQAFQAPGPQYSGLPSGWFYKGCLQDNTLSNENVNAGSNQKETLYTLPWKVSDNNNNTIVGCIQQCAAYGYNAAGLEYGSQCFCGDQQNVLVASAPTTSTNPVDAQFFTYATPPQLVTDSQCNVLCSGAPQYMCGAGNLLSYYIYNGTNPITSWSIPTGNAAGTYSLLIGGVVVPLITSQTINGKVTFVEKSGTGEPNGTGAYELDLSEINNFSAAWRTMTGLQTDVFCSAGLTLPDKGGRQLTVGGWAGSSNFGIRLYLPDGSPGVPGQNEWVEDPTHLQLQTPRWYPSAMILANGSILVVGGEINNNGNENPTLEILPPTGPPDATQPNGYANTTVYLPFLDETWPFNLYPFITVVPSGIFIAYWNQARILDEKTFQTIKTLPPIPGNVNDPTAGRTYQLEGAMVNLPQSYPYTDLLTVLICGGSTQGGGYAVDNCVSTQPEAASPVWNVERMPSRRVMSCMAGLPDGTYLILNGGQHGVAGFGLGGSPNYNAVMYDPSKPLNQRMSIMANTTVARLYHSEAITLLDGRVLVSGSDPTGDYDNPAGDFPEEYRVEVFTPPYLLSGLARPTFTITNTDWAYTGTTSTATFTVTSGSTANLKVSLLGSVVSTHGNAMGQRTLFPQVSCAGQTCTVTAPPTAHVAPPGWYMMFVLDGPTPSVGQFVRIGGDPAGLGSWPNLPGFTLPGS